MGLLDTYSHNLKTGDAVGMGRLFAEDGLFYDEAPAKLGGEPINVRGRDQIESFFKQTFTGGGLDLTNVAINGDAMRYDVKIGKMMLLCLGVATVENGLIKEYRVVAA